MKRISRLLQNIKPTELNCRRKSSGKLKVKRIVKVLDFSSELIYNTRVADNGDTICGGGGTGRRARLRGVWATIRVQVPSFAPNKNKTNLDEKSKFVLFFTRDYFGLTVKLK